MASAQQLGVASELTSIGGLAYGRTSIWKRTGTVNVISFLAISIGIGGTGEERSIIRLTALFSKYHFELLTSL